MKILFVVLTCPKNISRMNLVRSTWASTISSEHRVLYLSNAPDLIDKSIIGYNTLDAYEGVPYKIMEFFRNNALEDYDWVYICDDDTFCFPARLERLLKDFYYSNLPICICRKGFYNSYLPYPGGGAGFALNKKLYFDIRKFLLNTDAPKINTYGDVSVGLWMKEIGFDKLYDFSDLLKAQNLNHPENKGIDLLKIVSMHYCGDRDFDILFRILRHDN
jgi:hypothetical protein